MRILLPILSMILMLLLAACQIGEPTDLANASDQSATAVSATARPRSPWTTVPVVLASTATPDVTKASTLPPTATNTPVTPSPTRTVTLTPSLTATPTITPTPSITPIPTNTKRPTITLTPSPAVTRISTNIPGPFGGDTATWTPPAPGQGFGEHYLFQRPIDEDHTNFWARNYSFGSTDNNYRPVHHGLDFENEKGTPVYAADDGVVYYAGSDIDVVFGPQPDFYGNVIVIEHPIKDTQDRKIYSLYGHLSVIEVKTGETVKTGQRIGQVGAAGVAVGAHLHFEVRLGKPNDYFAVLNPELWIIPFVGNGSVAGRVMDLDGKLLTSVTVEAQGVQIYRSAFSYADLALSGDPAFNENFVIPDLPTGYYRIFVNQQSGGPLFRTVVYVRAGHTTWVDINLNPES